MSLHSFEVMVVTGGIVRRGGRRSFSLFGDVNNVVNAVVAIKALAFKVN